jgi:hypothetical protein
MNANELADKLEDALDTDSWCQECGLETTEPVARQAVAMLRQQQAEIEALRMGFAGNGTSDSELAEVRAMANRWFLEIEALKKGIIKIREGCSNVKTDDDCTKEVKQLATLIIRDCNMTLQRLEDD